VKERRVLERQLFVDLDAEIVELFVHHAPTRRHALEVFVELRGKRFRRKADWHDRAGEIEHADRRKAGETHVVDAAGRDQHVHLSRRATAEIAERFVQRQGLRRQHVFVVVVLVARRLDADVAFGDAHAARSEIGDEVGVHRK
jgi:hypothetical protein